MDFVNIELFAAFLLAAAIINIVPGPVVTLVVANALRQGTRVGLVTVLGAGTGNGVLIVAAAVGITTLIALMADLFTLVRWLGAAYLIWLGFREWRSSGLPPPERAADPPRRSAAVFGQGFLIGITNPKAALFYIAFFPQFLDPALPAGPQLAAMVFGYSGIALITDSVYAALSGRLGTWFRNARRARLQSRIVGSLLIATGVGLAFARRSD